MIKKSAVTLAATATTMLALSVTVASAQDWRRGTFEERRIEHRFGEFRHAQGKENKCERRGEEIECIISAHPCRER